MSFVSLRMVRRWLLLIGAFDQVFDALIAALGWLVSAANLAGCLWSDAGMSSDLIGVEVITDRLPLGLFFLVLVVLLDRLVARWWML